jgi:hypothetical protein
MRFRVVTASVLVFGVWSPSAGPAAQGGVQTAGKPNIVLISYRVVRVLDGQPRGTREIDPEQAATVRRIFRAFVAAARGT